MNDPDEKGRDGEHVPREISHPHLKEFARFLPELNKESDRGRVLISCSYLDELLRQVLLSFLIDTKESVRLVEGFNAPLGTFSTRATAAFALGLITTQEFHECDTLRRIRNCFAHDVHASFDTQNIKDLIGNLTLAIKEHAGTAIDARSQYTSAAVALIMNWTNRAAYVGRQRRTEQTWPY